MARSGALLFAKGPGPASTPLPEASRGPRGVVSVGCVRWQHSTTDAVPPLAEKNVASLGNSTATPAPPNVTAPPARLSASLDRASPGSSGATLLHPHDDPSSNSTQHNPTHTLELLLVPSLGSIIESPVSLRFRRQEVISSRDPLLMGTASVAACGTLSATRALLSDALCFAFWEVVQYYTRNVPTSLSDVKEYTRLAWDGWHNWPREFNVLLFPSLLSTTALQDFDAECTIKAVSSCLVAYQTFHDDFLRIWRQEIASASENGQEAEIEMPASIVSQAESVILLSYFDLCPDALLLPYDVRLLQRAETEEMSSSSRSSPSFPLRRKRRRGSSLDSSVSAQLKRFCCEDLSNSASALFPEKFGVANGFDHDAGRLPKCDNGQPGGNQNDTTDDDRVLPDEKVVQAEICVCEPSAVSELHETALRHAASTLWLAPLKPHGALRADKREVALHFSCALELRTAPATMEWSVISKYFRLFASQMACDDFSILVRFFQRSPSPIAAVGDLAGLLDLATATADLHLDHLQRTAQWIAAGKSVGGQSDAPLDLTQCPPLPATPFVQLSFHKVASNRSSNVPVLDVYITVWSCLPFLSQYLHVMLANADEAKAGPVASDGASLPVMSEQREQLLRQQFTASSFNFILSLPLPTTDASQVIVNGQYDLETVLENLAQTMLRRKPTSSGMLSLSLHRPLSKGLAKLFSPGHTYSVLQATLETPTRPPANSSAAEIR